MVIGTSPLEQPLRYILSRVNGNTYEKTWIGHKAAIDLLAANEAPFAETIDVQGRGATYTLKATYAYNRTAGTEIINETQEIDTESVQQSVFTNPTFRGLPSDVVYKVRAAFENKLTDSAGYTTATGSFSTDPTIQALAVKAFNLLLDGAESWENFTFVITRTRSVSRVYAASQIDLSTINKLFTTAQLTAITGNPLLWTIPTLTLTTDEVAKNLFSGWRKKICRVQDVSNGSRAMVEQWQLAKWSKDLYQLI
jgi:hypothetical protein